MPIRSLRPWLWASLLTCASLTGCGGGSSDAKPIVIPDVTDGGEGLDDVYPYLDNSPYAGELANCVRAERPEDSCRLVDLPLIGMETENPTVAAVMARVVVSHDWMGGRFQQALNNLPADILLLLRATTAIVIDDDIRPAYYTTLTGAIYLDPAFLWLTSAELDTINRRSDHRSNYSDPLRFRAVSRYVHNGDYFYPYGLLDETAPRTTNDITILLAELLYHELAHANDFLPPASWDSLNTSLSVYEAIEANESNFVSTLLYEADPLTSDSLYSLAEVMYWGDTPSLADLAMSATDVGHAFENDNASDHYAYASIYEDTAMLFEETMMKRHFNIDRDVGFTEVPPDSRYCDGYTVRWGVRNRVGDTDVKARAQFVTGELLPSTELSLFFQEFPVPQQMASGVNWCDSIDMSPGYRTLHQGRKALPPRDLKVRH